MKIKRQQETGAWEFFDDSGKRVIRHLTAGHVARAYVESLEENARLRECLEHIFSSASERRRRAAIADDATPCPYADTEHEAFCYWRGYREGLTGIDAAAHDALNGV